LASLGVAGVFVWWFRQAGVPLIPSAEEWSRLPPSVWFANLGLVSLAHLIRCRRWVYLLRPLAPRLDGPHAIGVGLLGYLAALAAPFRLGEFVRPLLIARTRVVGFLEALGSIVAERVVDGLTISLWAAIGLQLAAPVSPLPDRLGDMTLPVSAAPRVVMLGPVVFGVALVLMSVLWLSRGFVLATLPKLLDRISARLTQGATALVTRLAEGFGTLRDGFGLGFALDNVLFWGTLVLAHWTLLRGLGFDATLSQAGVLIGLQALGSLLPAGPGQFGAFQLSGYVGLVLYFPTAQVLTDGALVVFLSYASQIGAHLIGGGLGLWLVRRPPVQAALPSRS
jgi:glycosyltransferase 2 family protein